MTKSWQLTREELAMVDAAKAGGKRTDLRCIRCDCGPTHPEAVRCREPGCPFKRAA